MIISLLRLYIEKNRFQQSAENIIHPHMKKILHSNFDPQRVPNDNVSRGHNLI